jgi:hypothetical protein
MPTDALLLYRMTTSAYARPALAAGTGQMLVFQSIGIYSRVIDAVNFGHGAAMPVLIARQAPARRATRNQKLSD